MQRRTYIIERPIIESVFSMADYIDAVEDAFIAYGRGQVQMPPKQYLTFEKGDLRCMPTYLPGMNIAGVKNVNVHPANKDIPAVMATITLIDPDSGRQLAIMDGTHITKMRTGAAGAVAAKFLSRPDAKTAAFIGAGAQARTQLEGLLIVRPTIEKAIVFDLSEDNMEAFAAHVRDTHGIETGCAASVTEAAAQADIIVTTTPSRGAIVMASDINPGTHINAIGADAAGKQELDPQILKKAILVIDNWAQASHSGEINVALKKGLIIREDINADIGQIVTATKPGRESDSDITVFDSTGLAIQDISSAARIYEKIIADETLAKELVKVDFT
jgi:alanine dehydrogenase